VARNSFSTLVDPGLFEKEDAGHNYGSAHAKAGATGFRLPTSDEWELAARWRNDATNAVNGYNNPWFTMGNSASGATSDYGNMAATGAVAWYKSNASDRTHPVKGKAPNALGLYDMSGNAMEWCSTWATAGSSCISRGGSWNSVNSSISGLQVGCVSFYAPVVQLDVITFRPARTAN
jgi:formylglycine-generating enzyme required for sulfatase activity